MISMLSKYGVWKWWPVNVDDCGRMICVIETNNKKLNMPMGKPIMKLWFTNFVNENEMHNILLLKNFHVLL